MNGFLKQVLLDSIAGSCKDIHIFLKKKKKIFAYSLFV